MGSTFKYLSKGDPLKAVPLKRKPLKSLIFYSVILAELALNQVPFLYQMFITLYKTITHFGRLTDHSDFI